MDGNGRNGFDARARRAADALGFRIRTERLDQLLTVEALAGRCPTLTAKSLRAIEAGDRAADDTTIRDLHVALGLSVETGPST